MGSLIIQAQDGFGTVTIQTLINNPTSALIELHNCPYLSLKDLKFNIGNQNIYFMKADYCDYLSLNKCEFITPQNNASTYGNSGRINVDYSDHTSFLSCFMPRRLFLTENIHTQINQCSIRTGYYSNSSITSSVNLTYCDSIYMNNTHVFDYGISGIAFYGEFINCTSPSIGIGSGSNSIINEIIVENCTINDGSISANSGKIINNKISQTSDGNSASPVSLSKCNGCIIDRNQIKGKLYDYGISVHGVYGTVSNNTIVDNYQNLYSFDRAGIEVSGKINVLFNSVYMKNATVTNKASNVLIKHNQAGDSVILKKNILYANHPLGCAIEVENNVTFFKSDTNVIINESGPIGRVGTTNYYSKSQWSAATGEDNNSVSLVPDFNSSLDLHLDNPTGIPMVPPTPSIVLDGDGETRLSLTTIGADQNLNTYSTYSDVGCKKYIAPSGAVITSSGTFTIIIPNTNGYDSTILLTVALTIPDIQVTQVGHTLVSNATNSTFQWVDCNNNMAPILDSTDNTFTPSSLSGSYSVIVNEGGCIDTSACFIYDISDIASLSNEPELSVYPNPTTGIIHILSSVPFNQVDVMNALGQKVAIDKISETEKYSLTLPEENGVYFVNLKSLNTNYIIRVIKQ